MAERIAVFQDLVAGEIPWADRFGARLAEHGAEIVPVARLDQGTIGILAESDGFLWRFNHGPRSKTMAQAFLGAVDAALGIAVWPNAATRWHFDDKVAQAWLLGLLGVPVPETRVFHYRRDAREWARDARYPQVFKLPAGAAASRVCLVHSAEEAGRLIDRAFERGLSGHHDLAAIAANRREPLARRLRELPFNVAREIAHTLRYDHAHVYEPREAPDWELESLGVLFQEFLPGNELDYRITVIGERAFGYRRLNRPGDFRASGSGLRDHDPAPIRLDMVKTAHDVSARLGFQSMAYDFVLAPDGSARLLEISFTFVADYVQQCLGYWDRDLAWHEGHVWPQDAIADDLLGAIRAPTGPARRAP